MPSQLALLPSKFKNLIWVKRGDYVVVSYAKEGGASDDGKDKVNYIVSHICSKEDCVEYKKQGVWPEEFGNQVEEKSEESVGEDGIVFRVEEGDLVVNEDRDEVRASGS